jgi:lambda family phage tail tape measure protein
MKSAYTSAEIGKTIAEDLGNGISDALYDITSGTKSMKDAFKDLALSVLEEIQKMIIKMMVLKALEAGVGFFSGGETVAATGSTGGFVANLRAAAGAKVRGGTPNRDSVPAILMPGEYVLKKSAVDALGTNFLNDLNNNAAQTLTNTASSMMENPWESQDSEPAVVNVWVVSKEEEAQMGPNDVIATISKDIMVGGQTRKLIQSVVAGRK